MSLTGPPKIGQAPRPFTTEKADSVLEAQKKQRESKDDFVAGVTVMPFRVRTKDLEYSTPVGAEGITTGTLAAICPTLGPVIVDANLIMSSDATTRTIYHRAASTNYLQMGTNALSIVVGSTSADHLYLKRGSTTVMSYQGDSNTVTFEGNVQLASAKAFKGIHHSAAGNLRADGTFTFYAAATSGGAVTQKHDITFADGLITGWVIT